MIPCDKKGSVRRDELSQGSHLVQKVWDRPIRHVTGESDDVGCEPVDLIDDRLDEIPFDG